MPLDPSIYRNIKPLKWEMPSEAAARHANLANIGQRQVMQSQAIRQHELAYRQNLETQERARRVREIMMSPGDPELKLAELWKVDPAAARVTEDHLTEQKQKAQALRDAKIAARDKIERMVAGNIVPLLGSADVETLNKGLAGARARFAADKLVGQDPDAQEFVNQIPREFKSVEDYRNWLGGISPEVVRAHDEGTFRVTREARAAAEEVRRKAEFEATLPGKKVNAEGLTPQQAATEATRTTAQTETERHNRAMENRPRGTAGGTGALALRRIEDSEANRVKDEIDKKTKEFNRLTIETSKAWGKVNHAMALRKKGPPYPKDEDDATLAGLEAERRENAEDLERQKNEYYDDLVKLGAKKPMGPTRRPAPPANVPGMERLGPRPGVPGAPIAPDLRAVPVSQTKAAPVSQAPVPQTYTEVDVRKRAKAKGLDENAAVTAARNAGLIR